MKDLQNTIQESLDEALQLQLKIDKAVKNMWKNHKDKISHIVIIPFNDDEMENEIEQQRVIGPIATECGKLYGIMK